MISKTEKVRRSRQTNERTATVARVDVLAGHVTMATSGRGLAVDQQISVGLPRQTHEAFRRAIEQGAQVDVDCGPGIHEGASREYLRLWVPGHWVLIEARHQDGKRLANPS